MTTTLLCLPADLGGSISSMDTKDPQLQRELLAWHLFFRAFKVVNERVDSALISAGQLHLVDLEVIYRTSETGDLGLSLTELRRLLLTSPSSVTRIADRLERQGLLRRETSQVDRRETYLKLTPKGKKAAESGMAVLHDLRFNHFAKALNGSKREEFIRRLGELLDLNAYDDAMWANEKQLDQA